MTDKEVIAGFDGYYKLAKLLEISPTRVWHWQTRGIPFRYRFKVAQLADQRDIQVGGYEFLETRS